MYAGTVYKMFYLYAFTAYFVRYNTYVGLYFSYVYDIDKSYMEGGALNKLSHET
jgi:hypothetical protein